MKYWPGSNILKSKNNAFDWRNWEKQIEWRPQFSNKKIELETDITDRRNSIIIKDQGALSGMLNYKL